MKGEAGYTAWRVLWVSGHRAPPELRFPDHSLQRPLQLVAVAPGDPLPPPRPAAVVLDLAAVDDLDEAVGLVARTSQATLAPVIVLGGPGSTDFLLAATGAGAASFLPADPDPELLGARIEVVADRDRIQRELRRGHAAFHALLDDLDFGVMLLDMDGVIQEANRAMREMLEARERRLVGLRLADLTHPSDRDTLALFAQLAAGQRTHYAVRQRLLSASDRTVWLDLSANRVDEPALGEPFCVLHLVDASREVRTRHWLAETRSQYSHLFRANPIPTYVLDSRSLRVLDANPAAEEVLGHSRDELLRLGPEALWSEAGNGDASLVQGLLHSSNRVGPIRVRQRHRDGSVLEGELLAVAIEFRSRPAHLVMVRDIANSLRAEASLARARQVLSERHLARSVASSLATVAPRLEVAVRRLQGPAADRREALDELRHAVTELVDLERRSADEAKRGALRPDADDTDDGVRVLLVDDDAAVRFVICEMLERDGHHVVETASGREAMRAMDGTGHIELIVADVTLPDMQGTELVRELRRRHPGVRALVISGYLDEALTARGVLGPDLPFLAKPFTPEEFRAKVRDVLEAPPAPAPA